MGFELNNEVAFIFLGEVSVCLGLSFVEHELELRGPNGLFRPRLKFCLGGFLVFVEIAGSNLWLDVVPCSGGVGGGQVHLVVDLGDPVVCPEFVGFLVLVCVGGL